ISTDDAFRAISLQIGGDGKTITKDTLDSFIKNADSDVADLAQLKTLQSNWYKVSSGEEEISADNFSSNKDYSKLLFSALTSNISSALTTTTASNNEETELSATDKIYSQLIDSALNTSDSTSSTQYDWLNSYLTDLLSNNSSDSDNSDAIDTVINLLAKLQQNSMNTVNFTI
ncbi:hypothetical protein KBA27_05250, partial [bacterium]|nr:hypothetical protein [bacterium]